jgi:hypothetical protein
VRRAYRRGAVTGTGGGVTAATFRPTPSPRSPRRTASCTSSRPRSSSSLRLLDQIDKAAAYTIPLALRLGGRARHGGFRSCAADGRRPARPSVRCSRSRPTSSFRSCCRDSRCAADRGSLGARANRAMSARSRRARWRRERAVGSGRRPARACLAAQARRRRHVLLVALHHIVADGWSRGSRCRSSTWRTSRIATAPAVGTSAAIRRLRLWQRRVAGGGLPRASSTTGPNDWRMCRRSSCRRIASTGGAVGRRR